tara:strand:- start:156 stop:476 length:321 start_codon:yes stop_codon:yes gene_type:complete
MATKEELQTQANSEVEARMTANGGDGMFISIDGVRREYNDAEYAQAKIDLGNQKWNDQQFGYISARQSAYASIPDQLDMQYWDAVNGTTTWKDHIAQVKSDNPKPE